MLKELQTHHREIARLKFAGFKPAEIAIRSNVSTVSVRHVLSDPMCKAYISKLNDTADIEIINVRKRLIQMNTKALDAIDNILDPVANIPPAVVLAAAKDNLDRTGHQIVQKHQTVSMHITKDELDEIKQRAINAGACISKSDEPVVDVEYEKVL